MMTDPTQRIRGNTEFSKVLKFKSTKQFGRHGNEMKIDSMQKDGTQSWIVISRNVKKYLTEPAKENKKLLHYEESVFKHGATCCDGRKRTTYTTLIFVTNLTDQTTKVEGYTLFSQGY